MSPSTERVWRLGNTGKTVPYPAKNGVGSLAKAGQECSCGKSSRMTRNIVKQKQKGIKQLEDNTPNWERQRLADW